MIAYFTEDVKFVLKGKLLNNRWLKMVVESEVKRLGDLSIIFCSDPYILDVNLRYLQHDYFTDIITFICGIPVATHQFWVLTTPG